MRRNLNILEVKLGNWKLKNPVIPASGTFGYGYEFYKYFDIDELGSFSMKGTTLQPRLGNKLPRIAECDNSIINSIGLQNPGIDKVINEEFDKLINIYHFKGKLIANIAGTTIKEYVTIAKKLDNLPIVGIIEINVSCPNVSKGAKSFTTNPQHLKQLVSALKKVIKKPIYIKLSALVNDITQMALAAKEAGADGLTLINTLKGARFDIKTAKPIIANKVGGFCGPAIKPIALQAVYLVRKAVGSSMPIIGVGGIKDAYDVIEFMYAGANAIQVGTQNLVNPYVCIDIIKSLPKVMKELRIKSLKDIINKAHDYQ